jgi:hypothetical protein
VSTLKSHKMGHPRSWLDMQNKKSNNRVSLTDKFLIHPDRAHTWGNWFQNVLNKDKKQAPAKGAEPGSLPTHEANLVDIDPAETPYKHACLSTAINESDLSRDELKEAYMLDLFNKVLGTPSTNMTDLLSKQVPNKSKATNNQTGSHSILSKRLSALMNLSHITLTNSPSLLISRQQTIRF